MDAPEPPVNGPFGEIVRHAHMKPGSSEVSPFGTICERMPEPVILAMSVVSG